MVTKKIIDLILENGDGLAEDLSLLRIMGYEEEVFQALWECYKLAKIELSMTNYCLNTLEKIYYEE